MTIWNPFGLRDQKVIDHAKRWLKAVYETAQVPLNQIVTHSAELLDDLNVDTTISSLELLTQEMSAVKKQTIAKLLFLYNCVISRVDNDQLNELFTIIVNATRYDAGYIQAYARTRSNYSRLLKLLYYALSKDTVLLSITITLLPLLENIYYMQKTELEKIKTQIEKERINYPKLLVFDAPWKKTAIQE